MLKIHLFLIGFPIFWFSLAVQSQNLSEVEVYERCYARLTRDLPAANDQNILKIKARTLTAVDACLQVLNTGELLKGTNELKRNSNNVISNQSRSVLETLHLVHKEWFKSKTFSLGNTNDYLLFDPEEPALYFTRALFAEGARADSVLTYNRSLRAIRDRPLGKSSNLTNFQSRRFFSYASDSPTDNFGLNLVVAFGRAGGLDSSGKSKLSTIVVPDDTIISFGRLIGIKDQPSLVIPATHPLQLGSNGATASAQQKIEFSSTDKDSLNVDIHKHYGGGILGTPSYIFQNTGLDLRTAASGYDIIDRRYTSRVFEDLLCHQLPTLEDKDIGEKAAYLDAPQPLIDVAADSPYLYQKQKSCMKCHASIDTLAFANSNFTHFRSYPGGAILKSPGLNALGVLRYSQVSNSSLSALKSNPTLLYYRSVAQESSTQLVKTVIDSPDPHSQIGTELAKSDDFYACIAKRYYYYFTGINVPLAYSPELSKADIFHRSFVLSLGRDLKEKQNIRDIIKQIFNSSAFRTRNFNSQFIVNERDQ